MVSYWGLSRQSTVEEIAEPGRAARRLRATGPGCTPSRRSCACTGCDTATRGAAQPTRTGPAGGRRRRPRAGPLHHRVRPGRAGRARPAAVRRSPRCTPPRRSWRTDMPYLQLALELARGTRLMLAGDLAGIDAIVADEFADLAGAGDFRLGSGYLAILQAYAARLRGQSDAAHADLRWAPARCWPPAGSTPVWPTPNAPRRRRCAATPRRPPRRWPRPTAPTRRAWRCSTRGWSRPGARSLAASGDLPGAVKHLGDLVDRLRVGRLRRARGARPARPGPARPGGHAGRAHLLRRWPAHRRAAPRRAVRAGRRGAAAAAGPARPRGGRPTPPPICSRSPTTTPRWS